MPGRSYYNGTTYRYGYQGSEKDNETGLNNFDLRMMDTRLGRWLSVDPMNQNFSGYLAMQNNPVSDVDQSGGRGVYAGPDGGTGDLNDRGPDNLDAYHQQEYSQPYLDEYYRLYGSPEARAEQEQIANLAQFGDVDLGNGIVSKYDPEGNLVRGYYTKELNKSLIVRISSLNRSVNYDITNCSDFSPPFEGDIQIFDNSGFVDKFNKLDEDNWDPYYEFPLRDRHDDGNNVHNVGHGFQALIEKSSYGLKDLEFLGPYIGYGNAIIEIANITTEKSKFSLGKSFRIGLAIAEIKRPEVGYIDLGISLYTGNSLGDYTEFYVDYNFIFNPAYWNLKK